MLTKGTELWNTTTTLRKRIGETLDKSTGQYTTVLHLTSLVRYAACLMLESASNKDDKQSQFRTFQTYLKASKACIESNDLHLATKSLERAAQVKLISASQTNSKFQSALSQGKYPTSTGDEPLQNQFSADYYTQRIRLVFPLSPGSPLTCRHGSKINSTWSISITKVFSKYPFHHAKIKKFSFQFLKPSSISARTYCSKSHWTAQSNIFVGPGIILFRL